MKYYKLIVTYDGSYFYGFQLQPKLVTVQGSLEKALFKIYKKEIKVIGSGRTDAGVHATGQVVGYKSDIDIGVKNIVNAINANLPKGLEVVDAIEVDKNFHSRRSALRREYNYLFTYEKMPFYLKNYIYEFTYKIYKSNLKVFENIFIGKHDFFYFKNNGSNEKYTVREIYEFEIVEEYIKDLLNSSKKYKIFRIKIIANSFLYRMCRNIVGAIFEVLRGKRTVEELKEMVEKKSNYLYTTASPKGLYLVNVNY